MIISIFKQKIKKQGKKIADMAGALFGNTNIPPTNDEAKEVAKPHPLSPNNLKMKKVGKRESEVSKPHSLCPNNLPDPQPRTG